MNARLAELLTAAHGPAWRRRYGSEFQALLLELPAHPRVVVDALGSAAGTRTGEFAFAGGVAIALLLVLFAATAQRALPVAADVAAAVEARVALPACAFSALARLGLPRRLCLPRLG